RLRRSGWRVYRATDCAGLRHLAWRAMPEIVVLPAEGVDESGWLTCVKLLRSSPRLRGILVGPAGEQAYAQFVGAEALLPADVTAADLADCIEAAVVQTACARGSRPATYSRARNASGLLHFEDTLHFHCHPARQGTRPNRAASPDA